MMSTHTSILLVVFLLALTSTTAVLSSSAAEPYYLPLELNETYFNQLMLTIYLDETGKALVTGYVDEISGLPFLNTAEYLYENHTHQLYALTNSLTTKNGDLWALNFTTTSFYTDYHTILYFPRAVQLGPIQCSTGLKPLISVSNESLVVDIQGYEVESPTFTIEYRQPLKEEGSTSAAVSRYQLPLLLAAGSLGLILISLFVVKKRGKGASKEGKEGKEGEGGEGKGKGGEEGGEGKGGSGKQERGEEGGEGGGASRAVFTRGEIEITSEMARVIETLTDRERAIVQALLKHGGEMTQADLRYETEIPKSSLTGIIRALERRKIIKKKEWGRTNVIELSDWFLSKKGGN